MSKKFSINYHPFPYIDKKTNTIKDFFRPTVPIQIIYKGKISYLFQALVDSGSDRNLFPADIGEALGIDIKNGKQNPIYGIGGIKVIAYTHTVTLVIENYKFETEIDFCYKQKDPLLGRSGFFSHFKRVDFKETKRVIDFKV